jgi:Ca2+-binding RTX toxin-like protein
MIDGNIAAAWTVQNGTNTEVWVAIYNLSGVILPPQVLDSTGAINQDVSLTATNTGFAVAYEGGAGGDIAIQIQSLHFDGSHIAHTTFNQVGNDLNPEIISLPGGILALSFDSNANASTDPNCILFRSDLSQALSGSIAIFGGDSPADNTGNTALAYLGLGRLGVLAENSTRGDVNGEVVQLVFNSIGDGDDDTANGSAFYPNFMQGNGGNDTLTGGLLNDTIEGNAGFDQLYGGDGNDSMSGGEDGDFISSESGDDMVDGGAGFDVIYGGANNDTLSGGSEDDELYGQGENDIISGNAGSDSLDGGTGVDSLNGGEGYDFLFHNGDDANEAGETYDGGADVDILVLTGSGTPVHDFSDDTVNSIEGVVWLDPEGFGTRTLILNASQFGSGVSLDSTFIFDDWSDTTEIIQVAMNGSTSLDLSALNFSGTTGIARFEINGGNGTETIHGTAIADVFNGNGGSDIVFGEGGNDTITSTGDIGTYDGGADDDLMIAGLGDETMIGGTGIDTIDLRSWNGPYTFDMSTGVVVQWPNESFTEFENVLMGNGNNIVEGTVVANMMIGGTSTDTFRGYAGNDTLIGGQGNDSLEGGADEDALHGGQGDDTLLGDIGNDVLEGGGSNDSLSGDSGNDTLIGDAGNDVFDGGANSDFVVYGLANVGVRVDLSNAAAQNTNFGTDTLIGIESILGSDFNDTLTGSTGANTLLGGAGNDSLVGGGGSDSLDGGSGNDRMLGGALNDFYFVDSTGDIVTELAGEGTADTVRTTLNTYTTPSQVERIIFVGTGNFVGLGNSGSNQINGHAGDDRFVDVLGGNDTISAGAGSDSMDFRSSAPAVVINLATGVHGGAAAGDFYSSIEKFFGSNAQADTMTAGTGRANFSGYGGNDTLTGGNNIDVLQGNAGNDSLDGQGGVDNLDGGAGDDTLTGGSGKDVFVYSATGFGQDIITDFEDGSDRLKVHSSNANNIAAFSITGNGSTSVLLTQILSPTNTITLQGTSAITITALDFVFY